jgi:hypothetical protein
MSFTHLLKAADRFDRMIGCISCVVSSLSIIKLLNLYMCRIQWIVDRMSERDAIRHDGFQKNVSSPLLHLYTIFGEQPGIVGYRGSPYHVLPLHHRISSDKRIIEVTRDVT